MAFNLSDIGDLSYVKKLTLDVYGGISHLYVNAKQLDQHSRYLEITLLRGGVLTVVPFRHKLVVTIMTYQAECNALTIPSEIHFVAVKFTATVFTDVLVFHLLVLLVVLIVLEVALGY